MNRFKNIRLGDYIHVITDYHANGAYEKLKENIELKYKPDFAIMIRTLNFESNDFKNNLIFINEREYEFLAKSKVYENDIIMNKIANAGSVYLMPKLERPVSLAMNLFLIRFDERLNPVYMFYLMKLNESYIKNFAKGTTTKTITKDAVRDLKFRVHLIDDQIKITNLLKSIDKKIELNNKVNSELEAMAKLIYDYWFVQFDFPNEQGKPYKSSGGKMVWNEELKREVPKGWKIKKLKEISTIIMGQSPKGESYNQNGIGVPLINGPADYKNGALEARTFTTEPTRICKKDDLVFCVRATIGNLTYAEKEFCLGRGVAAVRPINKELSEFVFYSLLQEIERFKIHATGSIIIGITKEDLTDSCVLHPTEEILQKFHQNISPIFNKQRVNIIQNKNLHSLRDWLLPMLMNGQVSVGEAEEKVKMVAEERGEYGRRKSESGLVG